MQIKWYVFILIGVFFTGSSCSKKEDPKPEISINSVELMQERESEQGQKDSPGNETMEEKKDFHGERPETRLVVPDFVKEKWGAVKLSIIDRKLEKTDTVSVPLGGDYTIPDSSLKITVGAFLPDFKMDALSITSRSNDPKNPAVNVTIFNGEEEIFHGWLFSKCRSAHAFGLERFGVLLKEGLSR